MKGVLHTFVPNGSFHVLGIISTLKGSILWNLKFNFMIFLHAYFMACVFAPMFSRMGILSLLETKTKGFFVQIEIEDDDDEALQNTNSLELA
jgi:hypothetical protein